MENNLLPSAFSFRSLVGGADPRALCCVEENQYLVCQVDRDAVLKKVVVIF